MPYFNKFPKILYDIEGKQLTQYNLVTNIFFRMRFMQSVLGNISSYYEYVIRDYQTPEIIAEQIYGNPEAHWIILLANNIVDPQYDWPLNDNDFNNYIIGKYGSVETAQETTHHYEKVFERTESLSGITTTNRYLINQTQLTANTPSVPYDSYASLPATQQFRTINMGNGKAVQEVTYRNSVSCYDYELALNEAKRNIKIIKPEYYGSIVNEFNNFTKSNSPAYIRKLI